MTARIKKDGRRCIGIYFFIGNINLRINTKRQYRICRIRIITVMMYIRITLRHKWIFINRFLCKLLYRQY